MSSTTNPVSIDWGPLEAVLFDLDGVLTDTARLHVAAWKEAFDGFLARRAEASGEPFVPFDADRDYHRHVDGKPRFDGVRDFLASRGIALPEAPVDAAAGDDSVQAVGNLKNARVNAMFDEIGVDVFPGSVAFLDAVVASGRRVAVVTSSANCDAVLAAAGLTGRFEAQVDGHVARERGLPGKPAPDTFLAAAGDLGVPADRCVVVEDAISGVEAGRRGGFGLVVGVDRKGVADDLRRAGAAIVVEDLEALVPTLPAAGGAR